MKLYPNILEKLYIQIINLQHMQEDIALESRLKAGEKIFANEDELRKMAEVLGMPDEGMYW